MAINSGAAPATTPGDVELRDVSFVYPGSNMPVLSGVSLHIKAGEVVALVGENGAGKTTLVKLISRLYDPDEGSVRVDGVDVKDWPLDDIHSRIAFLSQWFGRCEGTVSENIAYGNWREFLESPERIREAAIAAGVHDLIQSMPQGYDTVIGRTFGEHDLSGGQWQQLAVARVLVRDASVLILDEPSAHLDARAEYELFGRFRDLARGPNSDPRVASLHHSRHG